MRSKRLSTTYKAATGIAGFDEITGGGLPRGRTTLAGNAEGFGRNLPELRRSDPSIVLQALGLETVAA